MYIGFYSYYKNYNNNRLFNKKKDTFTPSSLVPSFSFLKELLEKQGHRVSTIDLDNVRNFDSVVFLEFPGSKNTYFKQVKDSSKDLYLIAYESPVIKPDNLDTENLKYFKKVFTWADDLVDNKKYFKINYNYQIPKDIHFLDKKEKLCVIISSNKSAKHPKELYSERIKAIRWFENNHPEGFDLYGLDWDRYNFQGDFLGIKLARLNRLKFLTKLLGTYYPSYRGTVKSKEEIYEKYKFSICYENVEGFNGYITEKIFDCFFGGCVPIYLGAPNITQHIPLDTFIDKRNFKSYEELYDYLKNMPDAEYQNYLSAIKKFLKSDKFYPFTIDYFIKLISNEILINSKWVN
jgi:hypothetical protein